MLKRLTILVAATLLGTATNSHASPALSSPISFDSASQALGYKLDEEIWAQKDEFLKGISDNIKFLTSLTGQQAYKNTAFHKSGEGEITRERILQSLIRFRRLLATSHSIEDLRAGLRRDFLLYRSIGRDGRGSVKFTGYFQPTYKASRVRTREYQFPIYRLPPDFKKWRNPQPTRQAIEGYDGRGFCRTCLKGYELAYLSSRFEAFMIHVQGSALLDFPDGTRSAVGFAAGTNYPFNGISKQYLVSHRVSWNKLKEHFDFRSEDLNYILSKNNRYIFFKENAEHAPIGSLGLPVVPEISIATDKIALPPGALGLIRTNIPRRLDNGSLKIVQTTKLVLDQDSGSAIKGPGRVDIFMGAGRDAQQMASSIYSNGSLYYLLLRESKYTT